MSKDDARTPVDSQMVIVMEHTAGEENIQKVIESLVEVGYDVHRSSGQALERRTPDLRVSGVPDVGPAPVFSK